MNLLNDGPARKKALDPCLSCHVEAPAGSGKTSLLVSRYLALLALVDRPQEILALTFTNKAAGEMQERVLFFLRRARLGEEAADERDSLLLKLAAEALAKHEKEDAHLEAPGHLQIMTFHSFCNLLVGAAPAEAGQGLDTGLLDAEEQATFIKEVVARRVRGFLRGGGGPELNQAFKRRLLRLNNRADILVRELENLVARRDLFAGLLAEVQAQPHAAALAEIIPQRVRLVAEGRLRRAARALGASPLGQELPELHTHLAGRGASAGALVPREMPEPSWEALPAWLGLVEALFTKQGTPRKAFGLKTGFYAGFVKTPWADMIRDLPPTVSIPLSALRELPLPDIELGDLAALADLLFLGSRVVAAYEQAIAGQGKLDFSGLEAAALSLFNDSSPTDMQLLLDAGLNHILVDEFQDTSRNQWRLIQGLCAGWEPGPGRSLFLVGDPKQSIYSFRKAEVALFTQAKEGVPLPGQGRLGLSPLTLATNFRSAPELISWCNSFFSGLLSQPSEEADEVAFSPSVHRPGAENAGDPRVHLALFTDLNPDPRQAEALWLAGLVKMLLSAPQPPASIAVLPFARTHMVYYLAALNRAGIPVQVKEGFRLIDTVEGLHLLNLARALARPQDDYAWAGLLRAPWSWLPMTAIAEWAGIPAQSWRSRLAKAGATDERAARVAKALAAGDRLVGRVPLAHAVERAWEEMRGPYFAAALGGPAAVENCASLLALLRECEEGLAGATLSRFEALAENAYQPPDPRAAASPVKMMTVHGAKGLEFDTVIVPHLDRHPVNDLPPGAKSPPYLLVRLPSGEGVRLMAVAPDKRLGKDDTLYRLLAGMEKKKRMAEAKRLAYVAYTRAKRELILAGLVQVDIEKDTLIAKKGSFLSPILEHEGVTSLSLAALKETPGSKLPMALDPEPPAAAGWKSPAPVHLPVEPMALNPDPPSWGWRSPSGLVGKGEDGEGEYDEITGLGAIARGVVTHAVFETIARGGRLPGRDAVTAALRAQGLGREEARALAPEIKEETAACLNDPFLRGLLQGGHPVVEPEWGLEAWEEGGGLLSGSLDLVVFDGEAWTILDYKTTQFKDNEEPRESARRLSGKYTPQLLAYRRMLARAQGIPLERIRAGIYLTALQRWEAVAK